MKKWVSLVLILTVVQHLLAQPNLSRDTPKVCAVHFDQPFYTPGETALFKLYMPIPTLDSGDLIRIVVLDEHFTELSGFYIALQSDFTAIGYLDIPYEWKSGSYNFLALPNSKTDNGYLISHSLVVLSDIEILKDAKGRLTENHTTPNYKLRIDMQTDLEIYQPGDLVNLTVNVKDEKGHPVPGSLSVFVAEDRLNDDSLISSNTMSFHAISKAVDMESEVVISGSMLGGEPAFAIAAFDMNDFFMYPIGLKGDQRFQFQLSQFEESKYIQFMNFDGSYANVVIDDGVDPAELSEQKKTEYNYSKSVVDALQKSSKRRKVKQLFGLNTLTPAHIDPVFSVGNPDHVFRPEDFDYFPTMEEFLHEVSSIVKVKRTKKMGTQFKILNQSNNMYYKGEPLLMVDNVIQEDIKSLLEIDIAKVREVHIYNDTKKLNGFAPLGNGGVVSAYTKKGNVHFENRLLEKNLMKISGVQPARKQQISLGSQEKTTPDYRRVVYHNVSTDMDENGTAIFSFNHSDDIGKFKVEILVMDKKGNYGRWEGYYDCKLK